MLSKKTFIRVLDDLASYVEGVQQFENLFKTTFDNNFLTIHLDSTLVALGESFFTEHELIDIDKQIAIETVIDMLYWYAFEGEFGLSRTKLERVYVEDEGLETEYALDAFNAGELYEVIQRYLNPPVVCQSYTIRC